VEFVRLVLTSAWTNKYLLMMERMGTIGNYKFNTFSGRLLTKRASC
jgi:hypothetical protein